MKDEYYLLVDAIRDYAMYLLDTNGRVTTWNEGARRMKGYTEEEVLGKNFSLFFVSEDIEKQKPERELETALLKGRYEEEGWRKKKNGQRFWANIIITPAYSEQGEHIGFAKITRDLTEKKRSEELYLLLVNQVKEYAIFMLDTSGNILTWNEGAQRIKGYTAPEIIGKNFSQFYLEAEKQSGKPARELDIAIRTGKYEEEGWRLRKDGSQFWATVTITPIYKDRHIGFAKVTRDLTQKKDLEKMERANLALMAANKELERFAFTASHDLKEPLRKIAMFSNFILNDEKHFLYEGHQDYFKKIIAAAGRMDAMIEDLLNFAALGKKDHFEKASLKQILENVRELLEQSIQNKNATIESTDLPDAIIIPIQMQQVFQNLISNSLKFSKNGIAPVIRISHEMVEKEKIKGAEMWESDYYLKLQFTDNGIGFNQEDADRIFNLFDRLHGRSEYEGSGLGLSICKKIAENHGGSIQARSTPGAGSTFTLIIPA